MRSRRCCGRSILMIYWRPREPPFPDFPASTHPLLTASIQFRIKKPMQPPQTRFGAIILAAGASARLGHPKQTILLNGETLLDRAVRIAQTADAHETVVVLGAFANEIKTACLLRDCTLVHNELWANGMGTSIRRGIETLRDSDGALIMTCDMPAVTSTHLQSLTATGNLTASFYANKSGVPAYFPRAMFEALSQLEDSRGAGSLLSDAATIVLPHGELDIDTPEDAKRLYNL
jgi:molybdenum cofactor cytidylyltransferase